MLEFPPLEILLDDGPVLVINKPAGLLTLGAKPEVPTLERQVKAYLKERFAKLGNVYLGIPHRLDRPVSGAIVFTRNSKAAGRMAEQFRDRTVRKIYWGITTGPLEEASGTWRDWVIKLPDQARVAAVPPETLGAKEAVLHFRRLMSLPMGDLVEIELETGRMHQIRVQFAARGWPILGDVQYGAAAGADALDPRDAPIALHARRLEFLHPVRYDAVAVTAPLPANWAAWGLTEPVDLPTAP